MGRLAAWNVMTKSISPVWPPTPEETTLVVLEEREYEDMFVSLSWNNPVKSLCFNSREAPEQFSRSLEAETKYPG